ncbi:hypothetical protein ACFU96_10145 [Streptomyces sp. NPDC057620]|uniref:hypothetical protein n=1 Tax=Streptomyces sp. NPDC057620 TaxID=3346185 RepID=UPI00369C00C0
MARVGRRIASPGTVQAYVQVARNLDAFFAARVEDAATWTAGQITPEELGDFETWLYETLPTPRTGYAMLTQAVAVRRDIRDARPESLSPALHDRLIFVGLRPRPHFGSNQVDAYRHRLPRPCGTPAAAISVKRYGGWPPRRTPRWPRARTR